MTRSRRSNGRGQASTAAQDTRFFGDGGFFTPDRKARFVAVGPAAKRAPARPIRWCSTPAACATIGTP